MSHFPITDKIAWAITDACDDCQEADYTLEVLRPLLVEIPMIKTAELLGRMESWVDDLNETPIDEVVSRSYAREKFNGRIEGLVHTLQIMTTKRQRREVAEGDPGPNGIGGTNGNV